MLGVGEVASINGDRLALNFVGPSGVVAIAGDGQRKVGGAGDVIGLAIVERFELREFIGVFLDEIGEFVEQNAALRCGQSFAPRPGLVSGAGCAYGPVHVRSVGLGDLRDDFAGRWV